jgi:hypothetical protein
MTLFAEPAAGMTEVQYETILSLLRLILILLVIGLMEGVVILAAKFVIWWRVEVALTAMRGEMASFRGVLSMVRQLLTTAEGFSRLSKDRAEETHQALEKIQRTVESVPDVVKETVAPIVQPPPGPGAAARHPDG